MASYNWFSGISGSKSNGMGNIYSSFGDLANIKSGVYKKAAKKYYADTENDKTLDNNISTGKTKRVSGVAYDYRRGDYIKNLQSTSTSKDTASTVASIEKASALVKDAVDAFKKTGSEALFTKEAGAFDKDKILAATKDFVDKYNSLLDSTDISGTNRVKTTADSLKDTMNMYSEKLMSVGIRGDKDKRLSVDEDLFKNSDMNKVKELMTKTGMVGYQVELSASKIDSAIRIETNKSNTYNVSGAYSYNYNAGSIFNQSF